MNIADLDRKPVTWRYDRWGCDVVFREISALQLATISADHPGISGEETDQAGLLRFYAELLSLCVVSHPATRDEWLEVSAETLAALGVEALRINGLWADEEAKKN